MNIRPIVLVGALSLIGMNVSAIAQQQNAEQGIREYVKTWQDTFNKKDAHSLGNCSPHLGERFRS